MMCVLSVPMKTFIFSKRSNCVNIEASSVTESNLQSFNPNIFCKVDIYESFPNDYPKRTFYVFDLL